MAKIIKMTPELKNECRIAFQAEFEKALAATKFADGKLSFTKSFGTVDKKARVFISELAWMKITTLLREFNKEVAWHATAFRLPDSDDYYIKDVLVYPQTVTASTVDMDVEKYSQWLQEGIMSGDERFDHIRCQMHSHVNMGVFASGTDEHHQQEILEQLRDDGFYIFMILNKRHDVYIRIYDMQKNILFEKEDIEWAVLDDTFGMCKFLEEAKKIVKEQVYQYSGNYGANQGYGRSPNYTPQNYGGPYNPASQTGVGTGGAAQGVASGNKGGGKSGKKDKKKSKFNASTKPVNSKSTNLPAITPGSNACDEQLEICDAWGTPIDMTDPFVVHDGSFHAT